MGKATKYYAAHCLDRSGWCVFKAKSDLASEFLLKCRSQEEAEHLADGMNNKTNIRPRDVKP